MWTLLNEFGRNVLDGVHEDGEFHIIITRDEFREELHLGDVEGLGLNPFENAETLLALDDDRRVAVGHFEALDDLGHGPDRIHLALARVLGFHVHLGHHADKFILVADALDQA